MSITRHHKTITESTAVSEDIHTEEPRLEIRSKQPTAKGPAEMFTGDVWIDADQLPRGVDGDDKAAPRLRLRSGIGSRPQL
jgi:hypothetical protein